MKRNLLLFSLLAALSALSGFMMSKASWIGRVGMTFFYKEYNLLKIWWQGAIAVFIVLMVLFALHLLIKGRFARLKLPYMAWKGVNIALLMAATAALYFTYNDFTHELAHRMLGWRFHLGFYMVWIGWMIICLFFLFEKKPVPDFPIDPNSKVKEVG